MSSKTIMIMVLAMVQLSANAQHKYQLDTKRSKILWIAPKMAGHGHYGDVRFNSGNLDYSAANEPIGGSFSLNMTTMSSKDNTSATRNSQVDQELKGAPFLEVAKYPAANIIVQQIVKTTNFANYKIKANLTIKGITNTIEFMAVINKKGNIITATANFTIDRTKWNIGHQSKNESWNIVTAIKDKALDNDVSISLELVFD